MGLSTYLDLVEDHDALRGHNILSPSNLILSLALAPESPTGNASLALVLLYFSRNSSVITSHEVTRSRLANPIYHVLALSFNEKGKICKCRRALDVIEIGKTPQN